MTHTHKHEHEHEHGHAHCHKPANYGRAFAVGILLNVGFVGVEAVYGFLAHSIALLADASHNLSDVLSLLLAWGANVLSRRAPSQDFTYGLRSSSILAALVNAVLLLVVTGGIALETMQRLMSPTPVAAETIIWVAALGVLINTATALLFMSGRKADLNIRGAFLHMATDAAVSLGVVLAAALGLAVRAVGVRDSGPIDAERRVGASGAVLRDVSRPSRRRRRRRSSTSCSRSGFAQRIPPDWTSSAPLLRPEGPSCRHQNRRRLRQEGAEDGWRVPGPCR